MPQNTKAINKLATLKNTSAAAMLLAKSIHLKSMFY